MKFTIIPGKGGRVYKSENSHHVHVKSRKVFGKNVKAQKKILWVAEARLRGMPQNNGKGTLETK